MSHDAGAAPNGNTLCRASAASHTCNPQNQNEPTDGGTTANTECLTLLDLNRGDAGDAGQFACHVSMMNSQVTTVCLPEGTSRDSCIAQASCQAGYECVGDQTGACRRYCCDPNACDSGWFCDVQPLFEATVVRVPVCMRVTTCQLLLPDQCPGQTCAVVDQSKGTTSCVDIGPREVGEECETDHCAEGLVCLGRIGQRTCFKLCDTSGASVYQCPMGQRCKTNAVTFKSANVGICDL
jgi:hypothetical protein